MLSFYIPRGITVRLTTKVLHGYTLLKTPNVYDEKFTADLKNKLPAWNRVYFVIEHKRSKKVAFCDAQIFGLNKMLQRFSRGQTVKHLTDLYPDAESFHKHLNVWVILNHPAGSRSLEMLTLGTWFDKTAEINFCKRIAESYNRGSLAVIENIAKTHAIRPDLIEFINTKSGKWQIQI